MIQHTTGDGVEGIQSELRRGVKAATVNRVLSWVPCFAWRVKTGCRKMGRDRRLTRVEAGRLIA
jgi:hypothetical protein